jgi:predicted nucleic acid-binding protein
MAKKTEEQMLRRRVKSLIPTRGQLNVHDLVYLLAPEAIIEEDFVDEFREDLEKFCRKWKVEVVGVGAIHEDVD